MRRSARVVLFSLLIFGCLTSAVSSAVAAEKQPPNIVFIIADDLGYKELGCYGQKYIKTPNIDKLAKDGIRFTQFYSGNAVCAPSRCNLLTGKHPGHAYVRNNGKPDYVQDMKEKEGWEYPGQHPIPDAEVTIAEMLKQKQYATGAMGKWGLGHFGTSGDPNKQGFDLFYGFNCQVHAHNHYPRFLWRNHTKETLPGNDRTLNGETYSQDKFVEVGMEFIRENKDRPFFLYLPFAVPHLAIQAPEESVAEYRGKIPEEDYKHRGYIQRSDPRAGYAAMITHMDKGVGQIMNLLKELNLDDNTVVFFTSDNGPTYDRLGGSDSVFFESAGPWRGFKGSLYEGGIRVPLVVRWPGHIPEGDVTDHLSAFWDVMPTIAQLTGTKAPADIDGISFVPTLLGKPQEQKQHEYLYWEFPAYTGQQAVHMGDWKGVRQNLLRKKNPQMKIELYNLKDDPGEQHDVADQNPEVVARIKTIMKTGRTPSKMFPFPALDQQ
ncbi:MAG: arylsulfatase [Gimesia chilikensis]|uniref:arylsulfatase n=1 Tax=Gimesia chilikensis TaxID=2605989 RepID=UPI0037B28022